MYSTPHDQNNSEWTGAQAEAVDRLNLNKILNSCCVYCGKPAQGNFSIHRDGFGEGPEVPLCDDCGSGQSPTCEQIWEKTAE